MKNKAQNTEEDLRYLESLLTKQGCPAHLVDEFALELLMDCRKSCKSVYDVELVEK